MNEHVLKESEKLRASGASTEEILRLYRARGLSILESMQLLMRLKGISLADAKRVVHFSEAWADSRPAHERLHDMLQEVAEIVNEDDEKA